MTHRLLRWLPAVVVPVTIAAGAITIPLAAGATDLPVTSPEQVLRLVASSDARAFFGTVEQSSALGVPSLAGVSGGSTGDGPASALELLTGDHRAKVYVDGAEKIRVQLLDRLAERDVVRNGSDLWLYSSSAKEATHLTLPDHAGASEATPDATSLTPQALAQRFLSAVDPSTKVTLGANAKVAGRDAYVLVLAPRTDTTLVGTVTIAVDGSTGLPLRVQVTARGASSPAFQIGFTSFSDSVPDASVFAFVPPHGATVIERPLPSEENASPQTHGQRTDAKQEPRVTGSGWAAIVSLPVGTVPVGAVGEDSLMAQLTLPVSGGRALSTALVSALVTDDGRVLVGAVPVSALQAAAR